jgi:tetratricopeptide (TPR) repeat protein
MDSEYLNLIKKEIDSGYELSRGIEKSKASQHFMNALDISASIQDQRLKQQQLSMLSIICSTNGFFDIALMAVQDALDIDTALNDNKSLVSDYLTLGNVNSSLGKPQEAENIYRKALKIALDNHIYTDAASASTNIAMIVGNQNKLAEANTLLNNSLEYLKKAPFPETELITRFTLIQILGLLKKDPEKIIENAKIVYSKYATLLIPEMKNNINKYLKKAIDQYLQDHPELNTLTWKQQEFPWLFKT